MCDKGTMGWGSLIMQGTGALLKANAAGQASAATASAYKAHAAVESNNAIMADWQAQDALERGHLKEQEYRRSMQQAKGRTKASLAASGIALDVGTPLDIFAGMDVIEAEDTKNIRLNALNEAYGYRTQAGNARSAARLYRGRARAENPSLAFGTSLLGGASQVADSWYKYRKEGVV